MSAISLTSDQKRERYLANEEMIDLHKMVVDMYWFTVPSERKEYNNWDTMSFHMSQYANQMSNVVAQKLRDMIKQDPRLPVGTTFNDPRVSVPGIFATQSIFYVTLPGKPWSSSERANPLSGGSSSERANPLSGGSSSEGANPLSGGSSSEGAKRLSRGDDQCETREINIFVSQRCTYNRFGIVPCSLDEKGERTAKMLQRYSLKEDPHGNYTERLEMFSETFDQVMEKLVLLASFESFADLHEYELKRLEVEAQQQRKSTQSYVPRWEKEETETSAKIPTESSPLSRSQKRRLREKRNHSQQTVKLD